MSLVNNCLEEVRCVGSRGEGFPQSVSTRASCRASGVVESDVSQRAFGHLIGDVVGLPDRQRDDRQGRVRRTYSSSLITMVHPEACPNATM
jgi:hypothetical protein